MGERSKLKFTLFTEAIKLVAEEAIWDTAIFESPVVQVNEIKILQQQGAGTDYIKFKKWLDEERVKIVSCRLLHDQLIESMLLESNDFRFIEMVLHPRIERLQEITIESDTLQIFPALADDLPALQNIAERAFIHDRYHMDPRLDPQYGNERYSQWVKNTLEHPTQSLIKVMDAERLVGFFIFEKKPDNSIYWHLTAVSPEWQGSGYGKRVWKAMLRHHQAERYNVVTTTISARNNIVLNLYSKLGFYFLPPEITFHLVR